VGLVSAEQATFDNYKVFKIATTTQMQVKLLNQLAEIPDGVSKFLSIKTSKHKLIYFMQKFLSWEGSVTFKLIILLAKIPKN